MTISPFSLNLILKDNGMEDFHCNHPTLATYDSTEEYLKRYKSNEYAHPSYLRLMGVAIL